MNNNDIYKIFHQELISRGTNYPKINFDEIYKLFVNAQINKGLKEFPKVFFELAF